MIGRRKFITLGCVYATGLVAMAYSLRNSPVVEISANKFVGPPAPLVAIARSVDRKSYAPPIGNFHPDNAILDNVLTNVPDLPSEPAADIILSDIEKDVFESAFSRLVKLQSYVGYGNFNVISWDQSLRVARNRDEIGAFTKRELDFIEKLFFTSASTLGFYGDKVVTRLTSTIAKKDITKIPGSGHYLFKGKAADTYHKIREDIGDSIVLTSGVRSVVKQISLFLNKTAKVNGNLSLASYSLAPPGHSYHALGDFDVGKKGFGHKNFSVEFSETDEFKRLSDLGYFDIRYPQNNPFGVRYEPWHIKII